MGLFDRMREPVFLKESSKAEEHLEALKHLEPLLNPEGKALLRQEMKCLEYGIAGEKNIAFELKNSHMPMYILQDIYLEHGDLCAQIDYMVFTRKMCFVIECKNLYGNIEINNAGDFIRTMEFNGRKKREGLYSPLTQNQRHLELIKAMNIESFNSRIAKFLAERAFDSSYKSIVVLSNPRTVLYGRYAPKEVKEKVIRADQLVRCIKEEYRRSKEVEDSEKSMKEWAENFLKRHKENEKDYTAKYDAYRIRRPAASCGAFDPCGSRQMDMQVCPHSGSPAGIQAHKKEEKEEQRNSGCEDKIKNNTRTEGNVGKTGVCPRCGGRLMNRNGRYGAFIGCSNYPRCRYTTNC